MFDGRLWLRAGKQSIVWGKTELFRTTDQFNPQTLALSSLPSLEESRIALWSVRATWSFYDVGPLEDVRLEVAANLDDFEPIDLGRCGVPYTVWLVCGKTFGLWGHGFAGAGIAGRESAGRLVGRRRRASRSARASSSAGTASRSRSPTSGATRTSSRSTTSTEYERKVDPFTGRPLDVDGNPLVPGTPEAADLRRYPGNRQLFDVVCSATVGIAAGVFPTLGDRCLVDLVNSQEQVLLGFVTPAQRAHRGDRRQRLGHHRHQRRSAPGGAPPLRELNRDPADGVSGSPFGPRQGLGAFLTDQQEALFGCGPFYGTDCDIEGIDLFNAEASVLLQSFPQFEPGGPVATRYVPGQGTVVLPGARGPTEAGYSPYVDGCVGPGPVGCNAGDPGRTGPSASLLTNPLTGAAFRTELAAASYNFMMLLAGLGAEHRQRSRVRADAIRSAARSCAACSASPAPGAPRCARAATATSAAATSSGRAAPRSSSATRSATCSASRPTSRTTRRAPTGASKPPGSTGSPSASPASSAAGTASTPTTSRSRWIARPSSSS